MSTFKTSRIFVNSNTDRQPGQTQTNFSVLLPGVIQYPKRISVIGTTCPYVFPTFDSSNNYLVFTKGGTKTTTFSMVKNYDGTSLAADVQTNMNTADGGTAFTVSFDSQTGFLTITGDATPFALTTASTCLDVLGFSSSNLTASLVGGVYVLVGDLPVNTLYTQNVYVLSSVVSGQGWNANESNRRYNILYRIPVNVSYFGLMTAQSNFIEASYDLATPALEQLDFQLCGDDFRQLSLPDNVYWAIELKIEH